MTTRSPLLPLELRILSLEAQIQGIGPSTRPVQASGEAGPSKSITRRIGEIQETLERVGAQSEALKTLLRGYEGYQPLLSLPSFDPSTSTATDDRPEANGAETSIRSIEASIIPDSSKIAILLEAAEEFRSGERDLREIELLKRRGVEGSGELEKLIPLKGDLSTTQTLVRQRREELNRARTEVHRLLRRYNDYTSTLSDMFLELHHRVLAMEDQVDRLERQRRKDLAQQY